jgi:hypothetical protein
MLTNSSFAICLPYLAFIDRYVTAMAVPVPVVPKISQELAFTLPPTPLQAFLNSFLFGPVIGPYIVKEPVWV